MAIRRTYSPPFQSRAPRPGPEDIGRAVKSLVTSEVQRTNEVTFAVESFGCDGRPVLSPLRGLSCEASGTFAMAGTKNGMPFRIGGELPRGIGSAIRGSGGGLVTVATGASMRDSEWVLYDNYGNCWSLDTLTGGSPTYIGETPQEYEGDPGPALCTMAPRIRPYELRWEYIFTAGDPEENTPRYHKGGAGWTEDVLPGVVWAYPVPFEDPYVNPSDYWRVEQYIPDETTAPTGAELSAHWPTSLRRVEVEWWPGRTDTPLTWAAVGENSIDELMTQYGLTPPWSYFANESTRPMLEHLSIGPTSAEDRFLVCVEKSLDYPYSSRVALRGRTTGTLIGSLPYAARSDARHFLTPDKAEGWLLQTGEIVTGDHLIVDRYASRATPADAYGSALVEQPSYTVTLPASPAHTWDAAPVWLRVGRVRGLISGTPTLVARLPKWR